MDKPPPAGFIVLGGGFKAAVFSEVREMGSKSRGNCLFASILGDDEQLVDGGKCIVVCDGKNIPMDVARYETPLFWCQARATTVSCYRWLVS